MFFVTHTNGLVSTNSNKPSDINVDALVKFHYNDLNDVEAIYGFATDRDLLIFERSGRAIDFDATTNEFVESTVVVEDEVETKTEVARYVPTVYYQAQ